jgi:hypothetical protein
MGISQTRMRLMTISQQPCPASAYPNCQTCAATGPSCECTSCTLCKPGLVKLGNSCCPPAVGSCLICNQVGSGCTCRQCGRCLPGFMLDLGECIACPAPTFLDTATGKCTCAKEFYFEDFQCKKCVYSNCLKCTETLPGCRCNVCSLCSEGLVLQKGICVSCPKNSTIKLGVCVCDKLF